LVTLKLVTLKREVRWRAAGGSWRDEGMATVSLSGASLVLVEPSDEEAIGQWHELRSAVVRADWPGYPPPCWIHELGGFRHPWPGEVEQVWVARVAGSVVGGCRLNLPMLDNRRTARGEILVAPEHRRRGIGRALLAHLRAEATRAGRIRLMASVEQPLEGTAPDPAGQFAAASGAVPALVTTRRWLDVDSVDPAVLARLEVQARAASPGYSLIQWVGNTPQRWLEEMAYLKGRMSTDVPLDDLQWKAEAYDAARLQAREDSCLARGLHLVTTAAVGITGQLVAFTQIVGYATLPWFAVQEATIVTPEHRGHRFGMRVRVANLDLARAQRPAMRILENRTADSNPYTVRINEAMGFRPHSRMVGWQLEL
jgi:GNAT superfamily N-acetyltransferase